MESGSCLRGKAPTYDLLEDALQVLWEYSMAGLGLFFGVFFFFTGERSTATVLSKKEYFYVTVKSFITWLIILVAQ